MELSNGERIGANAWRLTSTDLGDVWVGPPDGFVGSIDIIAELRSPNDKVVGRQTVHLEWLPPTSLDLQWQPDREEIMPQQRKPKARSFAPPPVEVSHLVRTYGITRDQARAHPCLGYAGRNVDTAYSRRLNGRFPLPPSSINYMPRLRRGQA
jgi:hypothetical protein